MNDGENHSAADEAAGWFARMRGPDAERLRPEFERWCATASNDAAYQRLRLRWEQSAFIANTKVGRERNLDRAAVWLHQAGARRLALASAAAAILAVAVVRLPHHGPQSKTTVEYASGPGHLRQVTLTDGSKVILDGGTLIAVAFRPGERSARLIRGRARFAIMGSAAPFRVEVDGRAIVAERALFDVDRRGHVPRVTVWKGSLDARFAAKEGGDQHRRLASGQMMNLGPSLQPLAAAPAEGEWVRGMMALDHARLDEAVATLNHQNRIKIVLASGIANRRITGAFHSNDPDGFARAIAAMFDLSLSRPAADRILIATKKP